MSVSGRADSGAPAGQAHLSEDGPRDSGHSRLGLLPPDPRQVGARIRIHLRPPARHRPARKSVFAGRVHRPHCPAGLPAHLGRPDRQGPAPHSHARPRPRMGRRPGRDGRVPFILGTPGDALLPGIVRGRVSSPLRRHHESVVSTGGTADPRRRLVWNQWPGHHRRRGPVVRPGSHQVTEPLLLADHFPLRWTHHHRHRALPLLEDGQRRDIGPLLDRAREGPGRRAPPCKSDVCPNPNPNPNSQEDTS